MSNNLSELVKNMTDLQLSDEVDLLKSALDNTENYYEEDLKEDYKEAKGGVLTEKEQAILHLAVERSNSGNICEIY